MKGKIFGKSCEVAGDCLVQIAGAYAIETREIRIQHHAPAPDNMDARLNLRDWDEFVLHGPEISRCKRQPRGPPLLSHKLSLSSSQNPACPPPPSFRAHKAALIPPD